MQSFFLPGTSSFNAIPAKSPSTILILMIRARKRLCVHAYSRVTRPSTRLLRPKLHHHWRCAKVRTSRPSRERPIRDKNPREHNLREPAECMGLEAWPAFFFKPRDELLPPSGRGYCEFRCTPTTTEYKSSSLILSICVVSSTQSIVYVGTF